MAAILRVAVVLACAAPTVAASAQHEPRLDPACVEAAARSLRDADAFCRTLAQSWLPGSHVLDLGDEQLSGDEFAFLVAHGDVLLEESDAPLLIRNGRVAGLAVLRGVTVERPVHLQGLDFVEPAAPGFSLRRAGNATLPPDRYSLIVEEADFGGALKLSSIRFDGRVRLAGTSVGGTLLMRDLVLAEPAPAEPGPRHRGDQGRLVLEGLDVAGALRLRDSFLFEGDRVALGDSAARPGRSLTIQDSRIGGPLVLAGNNLRGAAVFARNQTGLVQFRANRFGFAMSFRDNLSDGFNARENRFSGFVSVYGNTFDDGLTFVNDWFGVVSGAAHPEPICAARGSADALEISDLEIGDNSVAGNLMFWPRQLCPAIDSLGLPGNQVGNVVDIALPNPIDHVDIRPDMPPDLAARSGAAVRLQGSQAHRPMPSLLAAVSGPPTVVERFWTGFVRLTGTKAANRLRVSLSEVRPTGRLAAVAFDPPWPANEAFQPESDSSRGYEAAQAEASKCLIKPQWTAETSHTMPDPMPPVFVDLTNVQTQSLAWNLPVGCDFRWTGAGLQFSYFGETSLTTTGYREEKFIGKLLSWQAYSVEQNAGLLAMTSGYLTDRGRYSAGRALLERAKSLDYRPHAYPFADWFEQGSAAHGWLQNTAEAAPASDVRTTKKADFGLRGFVAEVWLALAWIGFWLLWLTGYGAVPGRAFAALLVVFALFTLIYYAYSLYRKWCPEPEQEAHKPGWTIVPGFRQYEKGRDPQEFSLFFFSLDAMLPVIDLHAYSSYYPAPVWLRVISYVQHGFGWLLVTLLFATLAVL
jgi:hypothetical protein